MSADREIEVIDPDDKSHSLSLDGLPESALRAIIAKLNERSQAQTTTLKFVQVADPYDVESTSESRTLLEHDWQALLLSRVT